MGLKNVYTTLIVFIFLVIREWIKDAFHSIPKSFEKKIVVSFKKMEGWKGLWENFFSLKIDFKER